MPRPEPTEENPHYPWCETDQDCPAGETCEPVGTRGLRQCLPYFDCKVPDAADASYLTDDVSTCYEAHTADEFLDDDSDSDVGEPSGLGRVAKKALDREIPWRLIVGTTEEDGYVGAMKKHWQEWGRWEVVRLVPCHLARKIPKEQIMPGRVCYRSKCKSLYKFDRSSGERKIDTVRVPSARVVLQGFKDPRLARLIRDAPVGSKLAIMLTIQIACNNHQHLYNGDCKSAFLQGRKYGDMAGDEEQPHP